MKILLLSRYGRLGSRSRVRSYQYLSYLRANGIDVTVTPLLEDDYIRDLYAGRRKDLTAILKGYLRRLGHLLKSRDFDLLWIENEVLPFLPSWGEMVFSKIGIPYVVDYDDAIFHRYDMNSVRMIRLFLGKKIDKVMRRASLVIAGNDYLANRVRKTGAKRIELLPSVIDLNRYKSKPPTKNSMFTIGWIGSPVTAGYLRLIQPALAEVCKEFPARLVLVGSGPIKLDGMPQEIREWSENGEVADIQSFDVGIMPLPDEPWTQGKCGYKLIQYMACGLPVVASPVGINQKIVEHGVSGFLAGSTADWVNALKVFRSDKTQRKRMGQSGRVKVENQYCIQVTAPRLLSLLQSVVRG